ncbi:MAG: hypothetical protein GWO41_01380 [candidate division Zixibacteria bacterium]|nr:hypothetical protein [candidate division Zixibacteria bacterium]NIR63809.1 hypothetical protein [candidate division Zixibacteria bacterium]NIS14906.1 hypothetical protein [candidate division Zixibacteria bacterium]NIS45767.1 hypothetical protein [candidate division Zixibacteria bacterium]NIT51425.1 hypothetical protein [candidate division Zixibacteria bacterium]
MGNLVRTKPIAIFIGISLCLFITSILANDSDQSNFDEYAERFFNELLEEDCHFPEEGVVPDEETAKKIAEAVWIPIYGESIHDEKPLKAKLMDDSTWMVHGNFGDDYSEGGVAYAKIRKSDGKIICITHGM